MMGFEELAAVVERCTEPARESFYRKQYKMKSGTPALCPRSWDEWLALTPVTKDDLIAVPLHERSYLPLSELDHLRASSGTSGKLPLFSPRTHVRGMDYRLRYHDFKKPFLAFTVPLMPHWHEQFMAEHGSPPRVIAYDPKYPHACARLAKAAGVDAFSVFVYHIPPLGEAMKQEGLNEQIRFIEVTGEVCTRAMFEYMRATFPNATIMQSYGASEVEDVHIGMPCRPMTGEEPLALYHPKHTHYLELIDSETGTVIEPAAGAEGELLITAYPGEPSAFPLIRFRIGDTVRVIDTLCPEHDMWSFTVLGRAEMDFLKILGGVLRADEIIRVLRLAKDDVSDDFELHHFTRETPEGPKTEVVLHVEPKRNLDLEKFAHFVAENMRVAPSRTYAQGVAADMYLLLSCEPLVPAQIGKKTRRMVQH